MSQGVKIIIGLLAAMMLILIVSVMVWTAATVNQLTKDKDRLDLTTQKLADSTNETAMKVKTFEGRDADLARDLNNVRRDVDAINTEVEELASATGRQLKDIKKVIVEQDIQLDTRISAIEQKNAEYSEKIGKLDKRVTSKKDEEDSDTESKPAEKIPGRITVDVNNLKGATGWEEKYTIQLKAVVADKENFRIDWFKPFYVPDVSANKPDIVKKTPKFKYANQLYFILKLGDAADNRIVGVIDFAPTDKQYFPFDLYLDKDRDGDLTRDFISDHENIQGIRVPYKDGTTEEYSMKIYTAQDDKITVWYGPKTGRYGVLEANQKKIGVLVLDTSGNGNFNDSDDVILMDWDFDGAIDGSHEAKDSRGLYSILELPGAKYRVTEIDPAGRRLTLSRLH